MKKSVLALITAISVGCAVFAACGDGEEKEQPNTEHTHNYVLDTQSSVAATCGEDGVNYYVCECGDVTSEVVKATGEHSYDGHVCSVCGYIDMSDMTEAEAIEEYGFYHNDTDGSSTYTVGDKVSFGSYPQDKVTDSEVLALLAEYEGEAPSADDAGDWVSYGYYSEGEVSDYMFYKDVEVGGEKYRAVYMLAYRPYYSALEASGDYSYIDEQGFELSTTYWFKYSPLSWEVMDYEGGNLFLSASKCVEGQPFQALYEKSGDDFVIPDTQTFINDWENSTIRSFLNDEFYNLAFGETEQALIQTVTLQNASYGSNTVNDTEDNVFLLSYADLGNAAYFASTNKARSFTEYSTIQGLRPSGEASTADGDPACSYILRTAGNKSYVVAGVSKQGSRSYESGNLKTDSTDSYDNYAINGDLGILPALYIKVGK